jgi:nitrite reductase/ring-hydroxylating ferredoxin subunit
MERAWYPVALADGLERDTCAGTRLFGRELVVWRDGAGAAHVWEDRCPHRGMRLSFGFVRDNHIACLYHGWQYDGSAQCRYIPAHPDLAVPGTIRVATYPCQERLGIIWAFDAIDAEAPSLAIAECAPVTPVRSLYLDVAAPDIFSALASCEHPLAKADSPTERLRHDALMTLKGGSCDVLVAVQPLSSRESAMHVVIAGSPDVHLGDNQKLVSAWGEALRREIEEAAPQVGAAALHHGASA